MPVNAEWDIWIQSSIVKHFIDNISGILVFSEGDKKSTKGVGQYCEVRLNGPEYTEFSHNYWRVTVDVNVIITAVKNNSNIYTMQMLTGLVASQFEDAICIYKYGGTDDSLLECMARDDGVRGSLRITQLEQLGPAAEIQQSMVSASYKFYLTE